MPGISLIKTGYNAVFFNEHLMSVVVSYLNIVTTYIIMFIPVDL